MKTMTRLDAINAIRARLVALVDDEHTTCQIASERHLGCGGLGQYSTEELRHRYPWLTRNLPMAREELEDRIRRWGLARQEVLHVPLTCDAEAIDCDGCRGWLDRDDATLERFLKDLYGEEIRVSG